MFVSNRRLVQISARQDNHLFTKKMIMLQKRKTTERTTRTLNKPKKKEKLLEKDAVMMINLILMRTLDTSFLSSTLREETEKSISLFIVHTK